MTTRLFPLKRQLGSKQTVFIGSRRCVQTSRDYLLPAFAASASAAAGRSCFFNIISLRSYSSHFDGDDGDAALQQSQQQQQTPTPLLDRDALQQTLQLLTPSMASSLAKHGFWTNYPPTQDSSSTANAATDHDNLLQQQIQQQLLSAIPNADVLPIEAVRAIRQQSMALRRQGRFEQSVSERVDVNGQVQRFDKEGVFACEPDGQDYETAPDMLLYMSTIISFLPPLLNQVYNHHHHHHQYNQSSEEQGSGTGAAALNLSNQAFNAKLAVTSPGGSTYPLHIDNTLGVSGSPTEDDTRKLTCILYLNPDYVQGDGGELRVLLLGQQCVDLTPVGGRMVIFWSDDIPHEVLPCKPDLDVQASSAAAMEFYDRHALTIWIPDSDPRNIQSPDSKFQSLRSDAFTGETWC